MTRLYTLLFLLVSLPLLADSEQTRRTVHLVLSEHQRLVNRSASVTLPALTANDFDQGYVEIRDAIDLALFANSQWTLGIKQTEPWTRSSDGEQTDLLTILWKSDLHSDYTEVTSELVELVHNHSPADNDNFSIHLRVELDWEDTPAGSWQSEVTFELKPMSGGGS